MLGTRGARLFVRLFGLFDGARNVDHRTAKRAFERIVRRTLPIRLAYDHPHPTERTSAMADMIRGHTQKKAGAGRGCNSGDVLRGLSLEDDPV